MLASMGLERLVEYLRTELWEAEPQEVIRGARDRLRRAIRLVYLAVRGFFHDGGLHRASELTFDSVLGIVPLLAILFSALKGLGAYKMFLSETIRPWIEHTFGPVPVEGSDVAHSTLRDAFLQVLDLVEKTNVAHLGIAGFVALFYIVLILLSTVETALNEVYGVRRARSLLRRAVDYAAILFTAAFFLALAATVGGWFQSLGMASPLMSILSDLGVIVIVSLTFAFLYVVMPHRKVKVSSALLGSILGALLWYGALIVYARLQFGVARYNAIYSGFAALPLFLIWIFFSWVAVLLGAELGAAHENEAEFRWRIKDAHPSAEAHEVAAVRMAIEVARAFVRDAGVPPTLAELSRAARIPDGFTRAVLAQLQRQGYVTQGTRDGLVSYVLMHDPAQVRVVDLVRAIRSDSERKVPGVHRDEEVAARLDRLYAAMADVDTNVTLRDLAEEWERRPSQQPPRELPSEPPASEGP